MATTFDSGSVSNAALSGGDLTVTHSNTSTGGARSAMQKSSGKHYFEVTATDLNGAFSAVAVLTAAGTYANVVDDGTNCAAVYRTTGNIWSNNSSTGKTLGGITDVDVIGVAVDLDNNTAWFRKAPSGNWNGDGAANPATNTGGVSISSYAATMLSPAVAFGGAGTDASENVTGNFGDSAFTGAAPSGFSSGWEVPTAAVMGGVGELATDAGMVLAAAAIADGVGNLAASATVGAAAVSSGPAALMVGL